MTPSRSSLSARRWKAEFWCALLAFSVALVALVAPGVAASNKAKTPTGTPSTLPPTSPMIAPPSTDSGAGQTPGKLISSEMSGRDLEFFTRAVEAGRQQAYFADLLKTRASSDQIKSLADASTSTQNDENRHIARLAALKGWTVSLEPTAAQKKTADEISTLTGSNFDKAAMDQLVAATKEAAEAYQSAAQSTDPEIKSFATQMLPLAEEKRHVVEKMTGAGSNAAKELFRHSAAPGAAATPAATPGGKGPAVTPTPKATPPGATPPPATPRSSKAATPLPTTVVTTATPPARSMSASLPPAIVTPKPGIAPLPVATPK